MRPELQVWQDRFERDDWVAPAGLSGLEEGQVVRRWICPACGLAELSTFLLNLNHGYDPEIPDHAPRGSWEGPCHRETLLASQERARQARWAGRVQACLDALSRVNVGYPPGLQVLTEPERGVFIVTHAGHTAVVFDQAPITSRTRATGSLWWRDGGDDRGRRLVGQLHRESGRAEDGGFSPLVPAGAFEAARTLAAGLLSFEAAAGISSGRDPKECIAGVDTPAPDLYALSTQGGGTPTDNHEEQAVSTKSRANRNAEKNAAAEQPSPTVWVAHSEGGPGQQLAGPFETEAEAKTAVDELHAQGQTDAYPAEIDRAAAQPDRLLEQELQPGEAIADQPVVPLEQALTESIERTHGDVDGSDTAPAEPLDVVLKLNTAGRALAYSTLARFGYQAFDRWGELVAPADWSSMGNRRAEVALSPRQATQLAAALQNHAGWLAKQGSLGEALETRRQAVVQLADQVRDARTIAAAL